MGVHSTMAITRADAIREIEDRLGLASDEEIAEILFTLVGDQTLRNFRVVADYGEAKGFAYVYEEGSLDAGDVS